MRIALGMVYFPSECANGALQLVKNTGDAVDNLLGKVRPWCLVLLSAAGTVAFIRFRRIVRRSDRPLLERFVDDRLASAFVSLSLLPDQKIN